MEILHKEITDKILRAFYNVYNELGFGFAEKVYEKAMVVELSLLGVPCERQKAISVYYKSQPIGEYYCDIVVNNLVILEIKAVAAIAPEHEVQLFNYLKATDIEIGFVLNFGRKPEFKRKRFDNTIK